MVKSKIKNDNILDNARLVSKLRTFMRFWGLGLALGLRFTKCRYLFSSKSMSFFFSSNVDMMH